MAFTYHTCGHNNVVHNSTLRSVLYTMITCVRYVVQNTDRLPDHSIPKILVYLNNKEIHVCSWMSKGWKAYAKERVVHIKNYAAEKTPHDRTNVLQPKGPCLVCCCASLKKEEVRTFHWSEMKVRCASGVGITTRLASFRCECKGGCWCTCKETNFRWKMNLITEETGELKVCS